MNFKGIYLFAVIFLMPEIASYSFVQIIHSVLTRKKSSVLSRKFVFGIKRGTGNFYSGLTTKLTGGIY